MIVRLVATILWLCHWLPFRITAAIGCLLGRLLYQLARSRRRVGEINLRLCFPDLPKVERDALLKQHFVAICQMFLEYGYCWFSSRERLKRIMPIEGLEHLHALDGKPVILCMPHFTGLDLAGLRISLETPVVSIYSKQKDAGLDGYVEQKRLRFDTGIILSRQAGIRPALKALKQGYRFYYLPDQDFGPRDSVFAHFFGVPAATITGLSRLAKASGAAILPCYPRRESNGYTLVIEPALCGYPSDDQLSDAEQMNRVIEAQVLKQPSQYFWLHKRFKTRPEGESYLY
ncbi:lysophospholipid acyltransferase family protein [Chitinimonas sp.]|uniref:lysophospholipid acyltransferase family protein n=1 Tax=Chitinimonas sp. TaxID=1934313 RepID=UPI0035AF153C